VEICLGMLATVETLTKSIPDVKATAAAAAAAGF
jgi:hypothetical protein